MKSYVKSMLHPQHWYFPQCVICERSVRSAIGGRNCGLVQIPIWMSKLPLFPESNAGLYSFVIFQFLTLTSLMRFSSLLDASRMASQLYFRSHSLSKCDFGDHPMSVVVGSDLVFFIPFRLLLNRCIDLQYIVCGCFLCGHLPGL